MLNPTQRILSLHFFTRRVTCGIATAICVTLLSGCQGMLTNPSRTKVRIIDVSADAPEMDVYQNSSAIAYRLAFGTITSYVPVDPGVSNAMATMAGTRQAVARSRATLASAGQYTILIGNFSSSLEQVVLQDQDKPAPAGKTALRFLNQAAQEGPVDLYLVPAGQKVTDVAPAIRGSSFGANTGYLNFPAGTYTLIVEPAGTVPRNDTDALYSGAQVAYVPGSASTIVLCERRSDSKQEMQAIVAPDYIPGFASDSTEQPVK